jgi:hypothetical protein
MAPSREHDRLAAKVPGMLAGLLGVDQAEVETQTDDASGADLIVKAGPTFVVEANWSTNAAAVAAAASIRSV